MASTLGKPGNKRELESIDKKGQLRNKKWEAFLLQTGGKEAWLTFHKEREETQSFIKMFLSQKNRKVGHLREGRRQRKLRI